VRAVEHGATASSELLAGDALPLAACPLLQDDALTSE
jgi:hypothetical protein